MSRGRIGSVALTALYVPGDQPDRFDKAADSGADVVILDLEDAVVPAGKAAARNNVARWLAERAAAGLTAPALQVRVNQPGSQWFEADLALATTATGVEIRLAKVQGAGDVEAAATAAGAGVALHAMVETALGVESAYEIAAHPAVVSLGLGEADLASDLGTSADAALDWARSRIVVAARAAGLPAPMMAVYAHLNDDAGLAVSCRAGRALGFVGRAAVHPRQLTSIVEAFRPSAAALSHAQSVVESLATAAAAGAGVTVLPSGEMLDRAMVNGAREVLAREAAAATAIGRIDRSAARSR